MGYVVLMEHDRVCIRHVPVTLWQRLRIVSAKSGISMSKLAIVAITQYLARVERKS